MIGIRSLRPAPVLFPSEARNGSCSRGVLATDDVLSGGTPSAVVNMVWNGDLAAIITIPPRSRHNDTREYLNSDELQLSSKRAPTRVPTDENMSSYSDIGTTSSRVMLPMYMPSVMETSDTLSCSNSRGDCTPGGVDNCGGQSHCLRIAVASDPSGNASSDLIRQIDVGGSPSGAHELVSSAHYAKASFHERDLLRETWTEIILPVTTATSIRGSTRGTYDPRHRTDNQQGKYHPRRSHEQQDQSKHKTASGGFALVLQARAAGVRPAFFQQPPLWVIRRDFAERAVDRIVRSAFAAVMQPRVELAVLGVRGAIESMLQRAAGNTSDMREEGTSGVSPPLLSATISTANAKCEVETDEPSVSDEYRGSDSDADHLSCETYWNGFLMHKLRLVRQTATMNGRKSDCSPGTAAPHGGESGHILAETSHLGDGFLDRGIRTAVGPTADACSPVELLGTTDNGNTPCELLGDKTNKLGRSSDNVNDDPSTWFIASSNDNRGGVPPGRDELADKWMTIRGAASSPTHHSSRGGAKLVVDKDGRLTAAGLSKGDQNALADFGGDAHRGEARCQQSAFDWLPAEEETHRQQPFRFFLPACMSDGGNYAVAGGGSGGVSECDERTPPESLMKGDLRIMLWATTSEGATSICTLSVNMRGDIPVIHSMRF